MHIYVTTQGARIVKEGQHLLVKKAEDTYHTLFVEKLKQVMILGNVDLSPAARRLLLRKHIDTVFLSRDGRYLGRFATPEPKNITLRKRQFDLLDDGDFGVRFSRRIVRGKLTNMMTLLMRIKRTRDHKEPAQKAKSIRTLLEQVDHCDSVESLRGFEGKGSALYFSAFQYGLLGDWNFHRRVRRPPTDPVNAVLSLLYTFLFNRVYAAVRIANLDPYPAFLHELDYGRHSLVMDLMEEFRVIIADTLTFSLFNLKILKNDDFVVMTPPTAPQSEPEPVPDVTQDPYGHMADTESRDFFDLPPQRMKETGAGHEDQEDGRGMPGIRLKPEALKRVIEGFEKKLTTEFYYEPRDRRITYGDAMIAQAFMYRKLVEGSLQTYEPLLLK